MRWFSQLVLLPAASKAERSSPVVIFAEASETAGSPSPSPLTNRDRAQIGQRQPQKWVGHRAWRSTVKLNSTSGRLISA
jgi:hypothetical protein